MPRFKSQATTTSKVSTTGSDRHRELDKALRVIVVQLDVLVRQREDGFVGNLDGGHWPWCPRQLRHQPFQVGEVNMRIPERVSEDARREIALFGDHGHKQSIAGDVERHAQRQISRALIKLAIQPPLVYVELEKQMAG